MLLNLAEFMEQDEKPLPVDIRKLAELAENCFAYAKALHYRELEYASNPKGALEHIIIINTALQQPEAAQGMITVAKRDHETRFDREAELRENLHHWERALAARRPSLSYMTPRVYSKMFYGTAS